eukprot:PhM_4_TR15263/c0_g1_i1/m.55794/K00976/FPGT; fucose-1-phosphate guanylyltransferase
MSSDRNVVTLSEQFDAYQQYLAQLEVTTNGGQAPRGYRHIILTAANDTQAAAYRSNTELLKSQRKIPYTDRTTYTVVPDARPAMGCGGSTLHALDMLKGTLQPTDTVLLIHAGGYSKRLPQCSRSGKIFTRLPLYSPTSRALLSVTMLELKLALFLHPLMFPLNGDDVSCGGCWLTCSDDLVEIALCAGDSLSMCIQLEEDAHKNSSDKLSSSGLFVCMAHHSTLTVGTMHGVFCLEPGSNVCRTFLHKPTVEMMQSTQGTVANDDTVLTDSSFFMSPNVLQMLSTVYDKHGKTFDGEVDAYTDFLTPLGVNPMPMRSGVNSLQRDLYKEIGRMCRMRVLPSGFFAHIGTLEEYVTHLCDLSGDVARSLHLRDAWGHHEHRDNGLVGPMYVCPAPDNIVLDGCSLEFQRQVVSSGAQHVLCVDVSVEVATEAAVPSNTFLYRVPSVRDTSKAAWVCFPLDADPKSFWTEPRFFVEQIGASSPETMLLFALMAREFEPSDDDKTKYDFVSLQDVCTGKF